MSQTATPDTLTQAPLAQARIDWGRGRIIGFSVPGDDATAFDVVQLLLDGRHVAATVANLSVFDFAQDLAGMPLPAREQAAFELRIPQMGLLPGQVGENGVHLQVRTAKGHPVFETTLHGAQELLRLTDGVPLDLLYEVRWQGYANGAVQGTLINRHRLSPRPSLLVRINDHPPEPLAFYETSGDGAAHHFSIPLRTDKLVEGGNKVSISGADGQTLGSYPVSLGVGHLGENERKIAVLEAEVAFLKRVVLNQNPEALPARLALLKSEIVSICSEMLALQRTNFEREVSGASSAAAQGRTAGAPSKSR